jgi:hypothetical protein
LGTVACAGLLNSANAIGAALPSKVFVMVDLSARSEPSPSRISFRADAAGSPDAPMAGARFFA